MSQRRLPRPEDLVNVLEFEDAAKLALPPAAFAAVAGSDRAPFERITLRPRMNIPTVDLDMTLELLGDTHFAPILVGPVADQKRYHADAERATVQGAAAAKAAVVVTSRSSVPVAELASLAKGPLWFAMYVDESGDAQKQAQQAVAAGCKALVFTARPGARIEWNAIDRVRRGFTVPLVIKGVMSPEDAKAALDHGAAAIVVSNHGTGAGATSAPIAVLASVVDAVAGKAAVIVDGSFRRGAELAKALALGAQAVMVARPVMWGLAAYGAGGVQAVVEMLQTDLGRHMGALGTPNLAAFNRNFVRIHRR